jgi:hypothetical protein
MSSKMLRRGLGWAFGVASLVMAGSLGAQEEQEAEDAEQAVPQSGEREALQLSLQGSLLDYQKQTVSPDKGPDSTAQPEDLESNSTSFGLLGSGFGVGVGYAWDQLLLGARAQLTSATVSRAGGSEQQSSAVALLPRLEYMFNLSSARPFMAGLVGVEHVSNSQGVDSGGVTGKVVDSSTRFSIGAAFGIHAFLNRAVSLDPEFTVLYGGGSGTVKASGEAFEPSSQDYSLSAIRVLLTLGLSGWIDTGGRPTPPPARSEATEGAAAAAVAPSTPPPAPTPPSDAPASPPANPSAAPASPAPSAPTGVFPAASDATPTAPGATPPGAVLPKAAPPTQ